VTTDGAVQRKSLIRQIVGYGVISTLKRALLVT